MPLHYRIENGIVFTMASGEVTPEENFAFTRRWLSDPDLPSPVRVCRENDTFTVPTADEIRRIADLMESLDAPDGSRVALVAGGDLEYGVSRMYQAWADGADYRVAVFRDRDEAVAWLRGELEVDPP